MAMVSPRRDAVEALLGQAGSLAPDRPRIWPASADHSKWIFVVDGQKAELLYISEPYGGGLGPRERVAVFGRWSGQNASPDVSSRDIREVSIAVLLRQATSEEMARMNLRSAMSLLLVVDVGLDKSIFRTCGCSCLYNPTV